MKFRVLPVLLLLLGAGRAAADDGVAFFEAKIRPALAEHCYQCHGEKKQRGGLRLDSKAALLKGGDNGPALVPGKADQSLLLKALRHQEPKMPPDGKLPERVIADFARWVEMGAPDPRDGGAAPATAGIDWAAARTFWAFQPPRKPAPPAVRAAGWARTPIDQFILARLEGEKMAPVAPAGKAELLRRATFDLTGLPPTPEEAEAFVNDTSSDAFAKVVDRLLASPHYGERWGRYWLDVARYAEDQAHTFGVKPNSSAWRYRDWVIDALNDDMPYDRFVRLQIAADLIETDGPARLKHLPALGFFGLGAQYYKNTDAAKATADELDDRVDTLTRGLLGLTVSCARCHDHKFDPIPTQDYYSLAGVFHSCRLADLPLGTPEEQKRAQERQARVKKVQGEVQGFVRAEKTRLAEARAGEVARYLTAAWQVQQRRRREPKWSPAEQARQDKLDAAALGRWVKYLEQPPASSRLEAMKKLGAGQGAQAAELAAAFEQRVQKALAARGQKSADRADGEVLQAVFGENGLLAPSEQELTSALPAEKKDRLNRLKGELTAAQKEAAAKAPPVAHGLAEVSPADLKVYVRGNPARLGEVAPRRFLRVLAGDAPQPFKAGSGRRELAESIASPDNPLTARVIVNRVWQYHFGRPLVGTPSNFGKLGERPTHPELLDYLACRLVESGWSLKALHREIMLSAVYHLGTRRDETNFARDADNRLLWRMNRRRLDVEAWHDAMLAVAGKLDRTRGGPTLDLAAGNNVRRTVYAKVSRHDLNQLLRLFDFPDANITSERRTETTVPQQQLFVINGPFVIEMARSLAARVQREAPDDGARVRRLFALAYGRPAADGEVELARAFLAAPDAPAERPMNQLSRWERLAQAVLGSNEFLYVD